MAVCSQSHAVIPLKVDQMNFTLSSNAASSQNNEVETAGLTDSVFSPSLEEAEENRDLHCDTQCEDRPVKQSVLRGHPNSKLTRSASSFTCLWVRNNGSLCRLQFPSSESLAQHVEYQHDLQKYVCMWSGCPRNFKLFDARYKLVTHLRCHTGEKPYNCPFPSCDRSFSRLENLKMHSRTHTGEKPYPCIHPGCSKRFNNTSDRAKHVKTHIERKPYPCKYPGCPKRYTDPSSMRKHYRFCHQSKPLPANSPMTTHQPVDKVIAASIRINENSSARQSSEIVALPSSLPPKATSQHKKTKSQPASLSLLEQVAKATDKKTSSFQMDTSQSHAIPQTPSLILGRHFQIIVPVFTPFPVPVYVKD